MRTTCTLLLAILLPALCFAQGPNLNQDPFEAERRAVDQMDAIEAVNAHQAPWWQRSNEISDAIQRWVNTLGVVTAALAAAISLIAARLKLVITELRSLRDGAKEQQEERKVAPPRSALIGMAVCLLVATGCTTTRTTDSDGKVIETTSFDQRSAVDLLNTGFDVYNRSRYPQHYPYPVPVTPVPVIVR